MSCVDRDITKQQGSSAINPLKWNAITWLLVIIWVAFAAVTGRPNKASAERLKTGH